MAGTLLELSEGHELLTEQVQVHVAPAQTCHISNSPCLCGTDFSAIGPSGTKGLNDETYTFFLKSKWVERPFLLVLAMSFGRFIYQSSLIN